MSETVVSNIWLLSHFQLVLLNLSRVLLASWLARHASWEEHFGAFRYGGWLPSQFNFWFSDVLLHFALLSMSMRLTYSSIPCKWTRRAIKPCSQTSLKCKASTVFGSRPPPSISRIMLSINSRKYLTDCSSSWEGVIHSIRHLGSAWQKMHYLDLVSRVS